MRVTSSLRLFVLGSAFLLNACGGKVDTPGAATSGPSGRLTPALPVTPYVVHTNEGLGVPSFAWIGNQAAGSLKLPKNATPVDVAWGTLNAVAPSYKLSPAALAGTNIGAMHDIGHGAIIARFDQSVDGIEVFGSSLNIAMKQDMQPLAVTGSLTPSTKTLWAKGWSLDARAAISAAYKEMSGTLVSTAGLYAAAPDSAGHERFNFTVANGANVQFAHARAKRVWYPQESGIVPSWYVEIDVGGNRNAESKMQSFVVHAGKGTMLFQNDLMASDTYKYRVWADNSGPKGIAPLDSPYGNGLTPNLPGAFVANATPGPYLFPSLVTLQNSPFSQNDPWLPPAAMELDGNNVRAYADLDANDGYTPSSADLLVTPTSPGVFDRIWDPSTLPNAVPSNILAVTTDLFFVVNYMHDLFYDSGWNEASRNPQTVNYGRGGVGGDQIHAESQDSSGLDNANASTPADGSSPRIQMYLWDLNTSQVTINSPASIAGVIRPAGGSNFGPSVYAPRTKDLVKYLDVTPSTGLTSSSHACNTNGGASNAAALVGKFCLVDRGGTCASTEKAKNCLAAGAVGLIFANDAEAVVGLGAVDPTLADFPGLSIPKSSADAIKTALATGTVNITMERTPADRDGSVDGTIMSHEWGHILSNRLIGNANGLSNNQGRSMGEGWSDFVAMLTYIRPTDLNVASNANWNGAYPMGTYALGGTPNDIYYGIRRYPYSYDMTKHNPLTFKHIMNGVALPTNPPPIGGADGASNSEVHNSGEVWCGMLWDAYVGLLRDSGNYNYTTASQAMRDYLVASLKLTPNAPTFTEARDAWLAAAAANSAKPGDLTTFAQAFARRGMGQGAVSPARTNTVHAGVVESFVAGNDATLVSATLEDDVTSCDTDHVLDSGEVGTLTVVVRNTGIATLKATFLTVSSTNANITFPNGATVPVPQVAPFSNVSVTVRVGFTAGQTTIQTIPLKVDLTDASFVNTPTRTRTFSFQGNYDWQPSASATDDINAPTSLWSPNGDPNGFTGLPWVRIAAPTTVGGAWYGQNAPAAGDVYLVSPPLSVGATAFSFTFLHAWAFENAHFPTATDPIIYFDGGVVEISNDNGATWTDLDGKFTAGGYNQTLYDGSNPDLGPTDNVLQGRKAFAGVSATPAFPTNKTSTVGLGTTYANQTVRIRFRIGTDTGGANTGWVIDNIAFTGLTDTPFTAQVGHRALCSNHAPVANAGPPQSVLEDTVGVMLDGSGSTDSDSDPLNYHWTQLSGPAVALSSATAQKPTFTAPQVPATMVLRFQLVVDDSKVSSAPSTVDITVTDVSSTDMATPPDMVTPNDLLPPPDLRLPNDLSPPPDMVTPNDLTMAPPADLSVKPDLSTAPPADMGEPEDMTPAPLPPDMSKKGGGGGGCSTTGDNTPASTALPLFGLILVGFAFRRRTRRS